MILPSGSQALLSQTEKLFSAFLDRYRYSTLGSFVRGIIHNLNGSLQILSMQMELLQGALLKEGDKIEVGDLSFTVLHTPGHSPGSIVLHDKESRSAIVGDTVFCDGGVGRWDLPGGDLGQLISSLKRLGELGLKNMYPGHGPYAEGDAQMHMRLAAKYIEEGY